MTHKQKIGTVAYYVVGILIAILAIIPFLWMVSTSLKARGALMSIPIEWIPKEPTVASYVKVFSKFPFFSTIGNSLFISVTYTFITLISASMAAFAFAKLLMLDEPSLGLSPVLTEKIFELVLEIQKQGYTIILVEQNAVMALSIADRAYALQNGRITATGTGKSLLASAEIVNSYLG